MALVSDIGLAVLKSREGVKLEAYQDSVGVWTIGWGHTKGVKAGQKVTRAQAERFLSEDIDTHAAPILAAVKVPVADHEADALVSIAFNIGVGGFKRSTFLKRLNAGKRAECAEAIMSWDKPAEIISRRTAERDQFLTPYSVALPRARSTDRARVKAAAPVAVAKPEAVPEVVYRPPPISLPLSGSAPWWQRVLGLTPPAPAPVVDRPGLKPNGDPALWDVQDRLNALGYPMLRDGLNGDATRAGVLKARRRNGLGDGEDALDPDFRARLPGLLPALPSATRADASDREMQQRSPDLFAPLKGILGTGGLTGGIAALGAASDAGLLDKVKGTLDDVSGAASSAREGIGVLFGIGQWLYAHWWIILGVLAVYLALKGYIGWLKLKALWRQGRAS